MNHDDLPVGQSRRNNIFTEEQPSSEGGFPGSGAAENPAQPLSLQEKLLSKNWKSRMEGYTDLQSLASSCSKEASNKLELAKHLASFPKFLADSHPSAQEKAYEAFAGVLALPEMVKADDVPNLAAVIVEKGLTSVKSNIKGKAEEAVLGLFKIAESDLLSSVQKVIEGGAKKNPKMASAGIYCLKCLLVSAQEGLKDKLPEILPLVGKIGGNSTHIGVRTEAMALFKEAHKAIGGKVFDFMADLKQAQQEELKSELEESKKDKGKSPGQGHGRPSLEKKRGMGEEVMEEEKGAAPKQEVLSGLCSITQYDEAWCKNLLSMKKWNEKKEKLDELEKQIASGAFSSAPSASCGELIKALSKLIADPNLIVANACMKITSQLVTAMDKNFCGFIHSILPNVFKGMKDRKTLAGAQQLLGSTFQIMKWEEYLDDFNSAINDKAPAIRINVCKWVEQNLLPNCNGSGLKKIISSELYGSIIKMTDEATGEVRDTAIGCLSVFFAKLGLEDSDLKKSVADFNQQKQEKLNKMIELAKANQSCPSAIKLAAIDKKPSGACPILITKNGMPRQNSNKAIPMVAPSSTNNGTSLRPLTAASNSKKRLGSQNPHNHQATTAASSKSVTQSSGQSEDEDSYEEMTIEDAEKQVTTSLNIPADIISHCEHKDWKERQKGIQDLHNWASANSSSLKDSLEPFSIYFKKKVIKDFKESNQSILKEAFGFLQFLFTSIVPTKKVAHCMVPGLCEKLSDTKWTENIYGIIMLLSDSAGPSYTTNLILKSFTSNQKNLNLVKSALNLIGNMLDTYSASLLPLKPIVDATKLALSHANKQVRDSATQLLCVVYSFTGESVKQLLQDLKPALLQVIEQEFSKMVLKTPAEAALIKRQLKGEASKTGSLKKPQGSAADSLIPRSNISGQISSKLLEKLSDGSMKLRQEAKEEIEKILAGASNRIEAQGLSGLMNSMKAKMSEPCKSLARGFISLMGSLAKAMGPGVKQYAKLVLPSLIGNLGDKQNYIRTETCSAMNAFADAIGAEAIINTCALSLEEKSPDLKLEILKWVVGHKKELSKAECGLLVSGLVSGLQDKSKEIRGLAAEIIEVIAPTVGIAPFMSIIQDLKPTVKTTLTKTIEKFFTIGQPVAAKTPSPANHACPEPMAIETSLNKALSCQPTITPFNTAAPADRPATAAILRPEPMQDNYMAAPSQQSKDNAPEEKKSNKVSTPIVKIALTQDSRMDQQKTPGEDNSVKAGLPASQKQVSPCLAASYTSPARSQSSNQSAPSNTLAVETVIISIPHSLTKEKRSDSTKWNISDIKEEHIEKVKKQLKQIVHPNLLEYMFSGQLKKQLESIRVLSDSLKSGIELTQLIEVLDLFFKYITIILFDQSNTAIIKASMEYLKLLFDKLADLRYSFNELEGSIVLPLLCEKLGIQNPSVKETVQQAFQAGNKLFPAKNIFIYLMRTLDSKHAHTKAECLIKLKSMIAEHGLKIISAREIKAFGKLLCHGSDTTVKAEVIEVIVEIYKFKGSAIWSLLKEVPEKVKEYLKTRFAGVSPKIEPEKQVPARPSTSGSIPSQSQEEVKTTPQKPILPVLAFSPTLSDEKPNHANSVSKITSVRQALEIMLTPDPAKRVDALIYISEQASNPDAAPLKNDIDQIFQAFARILQETFGCNCTASNIRLIKYFMTVMNRICTVKSIVKNASIVSMSELMEALLISIQYPGLAKLGEKNEGEAVLKLLNLTMLKLLDNCDPTGVFCGLISLFHKHKNATLGENNSKLPGLIVKCILKMTKVIDSLLPSLDISKILLLLHENMPSSQDQQKNENEEIGQRIAKTIINELVKLKRETIWEYYAPVQTHQRPDLQIKRWITIILSTLNSFGYANPALTSSENAIQPLLSDRRHTGDLGNTLPSLISCTRASAESDQLSQSEATLAALKSMIEGLNNERTFQESIEKLRGYKNGHPGVDLAKYFQGCGKEFSTKVLSLINGEPCVGVLESSSNTNAVSGNVCADVTPKPLGQMNSVILKNRCNDAFAKAKEASKAGSNENSSKCS